MKQFEHRPSVYYQGDDPLTRSSFSNRSLGELTRLVQDYELIVIDEAQQIPNIGPTLKLLIDNFPDKQIIATGSSSFDLANNINEPLTGRKREFCLYPLSLQEIKNQFNPVERQALLPQIMRFGLYPRVFGASEVVAREEITEIAKSYLYKDILSFEDIVKPEALDKILIALAFQIGNEVSYTKLANLVDLDQSTVQRYISLLEKAFVIFRLGAYSRNLRNEKSRSRKIYFYDVGFRNYLIKSFNELEYRQDVGGLWENVCVVERMKYLAYNQHNVNSYYWRNYQQQEVDYLEEADGKIRALEFKWNTDKKIRQPREFVEEYLNGEFVQRISRNNLWEWVAS